MNTLEKIQQEIKVFEQKKKDLFSELEKEFPKLFIPLFEKSKFINSIGFRMYIPYFNDGDECTFSVYSDDLEINEESEYDLDWYDWRIRHYLENPEGEYKDLLKDNPSLNLEEYKILQEFKEVLGSIPDEFFQSLFGSHQKITIFKNGEITNEEYDHD